MVGAMVHPSLVWSHQQAPRDRVVRVITLKGIPCDAIPLTMDAVTMFYRKARARLLQLEAEGLMVDQTDWLERLELEEGL